MTWNAFDERLKEVCQGLTHDMIVVVVVVVIRAALWGAGSEDFVGWEFTLH